MTDNEIIKALNDCRDISCNDCLLCNDLCEIDHGGVPAFIIDLINRQKAEIERLNLENSQITASIKRLKKLYETYPDDEEASALYLIRQINEIVKEAKGNNDE